MNEGNRPTVGHFVATYLPYGGAWIYNQLVHLQSFRPVVLTRRIEHLDQFPFDPIWEYRRPFRDARSAPLKAVRKVHETILVPQWRYFARVVEKENMCLLHAHFGEWGYRCLHLKRRTGVPLVTTFYGWDMSMLPASSPVWRERYRVLFGEGDLFLAEGPAMRRRLIELGCPPAKACLHHLGVAVERIECRLRRPSAGAPVRLLAASNFTEKKGMPYLAQAFAQTHRLRGNLTLTFVGDGPERAQVERIVGETDARDAVRFEGVVPYARLLDLAYQHHLFVHPSVTASDGNTEGGAPVVLLDMQATGMPVIATHHADIPHVVREGETGVLVPERDVPGLASAIISLAQQPALWLEMGRAARHLVETEFDARRQARRLEVRYSEVLAKHSRCGPPALRDDRPPVAGCREWVCGARKTGSAGSALCLSVPRRLRRKGRHLRGA